MEASKCIAAVKENIGRVMIGSASVIDLLLTAMIADGHVLIEDVPGMGKTVLAKSLAKSVSARFSRIQFTPDLLPSDVTGLNYFNQKENEFIFSPGPAFCNILLADEINRAIPRTQSALLEAMEERQISIDGEQFALPTPFLVLATQNPVESESTFRLPAAQMDRFLIRISMGYPKPEEEREMLRNLGDEIPFDTVRAVTNAQELSRAQQQVAAVHVSDAVADYIVALADMTRRHDQLVMGASPRASRGLYRAAKVWAAMQGRDYVTPDDVKALAHPVLGHRLVLSGAARFSGASAASVLGDVLSRVEAAPALKGERA